MAPSKAGYIWDSDDSGNLVLHWLIYLVKDKWKVKINDRLLGQSYLFPIALKRKIDT